MNPQVISKLKANLRGRVILPEDQDYNQARKVYNGMIDRHPKTIVSVRTQGMFVLPSSLLERTSCQSQFEAAATTVRVWGRAMMAW
jgi:hypothetical protein